jgi:hypothetical protein
LVIVALLAAVAIASPSPAVAATPTPQQIFDKTFARLASYPIAPYALVLLKDTFHAAPTVPGGRDVDGQYPGLYAFRTADRSENAAPFIPNSKSLPDANVYHDQPRGPFLWQIRSQTFRAPDQTPPPQESQTSQRPASLPLPDVPEPLKTIGHEVVYAPPNYAIENSGVETVNGRAAYHLTLTPTSDPRLHNLREIWVDTSTFDLLKARYDGQYHPFPGTADSASEFVSEFKGIGPYWIESHVTWNWADFRDQLAWNFDRETYAIMFPETLPDWVFDQKAYDQHRKAGEPDILDEMLRTAPDAR